jgi:hypothetical protein
MSQKQRKQNRRVPAFTEKFSFVEREMGVEPTTTCLEGRGSTAELLPHS